MSSQVFKVDIGWFGRWRPTATSISAVNQGTWSMPGRREVDIQRSNDQRRSHRGAKMVKSWMLSRCGVWCLAPFHARLPVFHISRFKLRSFQPDGSPWGGWNVAGFRTVQTLVFGVFPFVIVRPSSIGHRAAFPPHLHPPSKYRRNRRPRRSPSRAGCRLVLYFLHHHTPLKSIRGKKRRERAHRSGLGPAATDRGVRHRPKFESSSD